MPVPGALLNTVGSTRGFADHLRDASSRTSRAERLAAQIDRACIETEAALQASVAARDDQQLAWLVLCDRGWCSADRNAPYDIEPVRRWLTTWADFVSLPVRVVAPQDQVRFSLLRRVLTRLEVDLRAAIPPSVWNIVDPLDETGRATLACALLALEGWVEMSARAEAVERAKARHVAFLSLLDELARSLGLTVPAARLDLSGWGDVARAAREMAGVARQGSAA